MSVPVGIRIQESHRPRRVTPQRHYLQYAVAKRNGVTVVECDVGRDRHPADLGCPRVTPGTGLTGDFAQRLPVVVMLVGRDDAPQWGSAGSVFKYRKDPICVV